MTTPNPNNDPNTCPNTDLTAAAAHRQLHTTLHRLRTTTGKTQTKIARRRGWSAAKVSRIEAGHVRISRPDLLALLTDYGVTDQDERNRLLDLARVARQPMPFATFGDVLTPTSIRLLRHEACASHIREVALSTIPDLLQTPAYTRALITGSLRSDAATAERFADCTATRQRLSTRTRPPQLAFLINESVLLRPVGGIAVMANQLDRLTTIAQRPNVSIQILPHAFGAHPGLRGSHTHLQMPTDALATDPQLSDTDLVFTDTKLGDPIVDIDPDTVDLYREQFDVAQTHAPALHKLPIFVGRARHRLLTDAEYRS